MPRPLLPLLLTIFLPFSLLANGIFTTDDRSILKDGVEFEAKGVCYQPAAIGENPSTGYPFGDYFYTDANNSGVDEGYPERWKRDFENFAKLGVNVIRVYGWDPNQDHTEFLGMAQEHNISVLLNRFIDPAADFTDASGTPGYQPSAAVINYANEWSAMATENANHPAVMGFLIGNETNASDPPNFFQAINYIAGIVKGIAPNKLVSTAITDRLDQVTTYDTTVTNFDFWAIQIYRGSSFGTAFTDYAIASEKPMIVTECGHDALDGRVNLEWANNAEEAALAISSLWNEVLVDEASADICSGVCFFEYADEWWKDSAAGQNSVQNFGPAWPGPYLDNEINEEWWGLFRVINNGNEPDILEPREAFYTLAAVWNEPEVLELSATSSGNMAQIVFQQPKHLRNQGLLVETSNDLINWTTIASNNGSLYLNSQVEPAEVSNIENGCSVDVTIDYDMSGSSSTSLLTNGDLETGAIAPWLAGGGASNNYGHDGSTFSLELAAAGGFTVPVAFQEVPASPGDEFYFSGWMLTPSALPTNATNGLLKIVFRDAGGNDLPPASISIGLPNPGFPGAESLPMLNDASSPGVWQFSEAQAVAPAGTVSVRFFVIAVDESPATMYFDSICAELVLPIVPSAPVLYFRATSFGG